jgi:hypothetical protein
MATSVYTHSQLETEIDAVFAKFGFSRPYVNYPTSVETTYMELATDFLKKRV